MRELDGIELQGLTQSGQTSHASGAENTNLLGHDAVEINEGRGHHVEEPVGKPLGIFYVSIPFQSDPCHDLMGWPSVPNM